MFFYVEWFPVKHAAPRFPVTKYATKKKKRKEKEKTKKKKERYLDGLISQVNVLPVFYIEVPCTTVC